MTRLTRTARVLHLDDVDDRVYFNARDEDTRHVATEISFSAEDYRALGSPGKVTVTIEPGDTLTPSGSHPCGALSQVDTVAGDDRPHSRACGISCRGHGPACSRNCPTCGGRS